MPQTDTLIVVRGVVAIDSIVVAGIPQIDAIPVVRDAVIGDLIRV